MSWVLLALRKSELKMTQSQYVARELQISRAQRKAARGYQLEQSHVRNQMRSQKNALYTEYKGQKERINEQISSLYEQRSNVANYENNVAAYNENLEKMSKLKYPHSSDKAEYDELAEANNELRKAIDNSGSYKTTDIGTKIFASDKNSSVSDEKDRIDSEILKLQTQLTSVKEEYEHNANEAQNNGEEELERLENDANDEDTMFEEEKVQNETQLESVKQELQTISDAISEYIQSEAIKI